MVARMIISLTSLLLAVPAFAADNGLIGPDASNLLLIILGVAGVLFGRRFAMGNRKNDSKE